MNWLSIQNTLTGILFVNTGQNLDQRRLARPIFAHKGMDLTLSQCEVHIVQSSNSRKGLADSLHIEYSF